jgi:hypothetical protein
VASSVIAAVLDKVAGLTMPTGVLFFFDEAPLKSGPTGSAVAVVPPYVVLQDDGTDVTEHLDGAPGRPWEVTAFRLEVYATSLAQADQIAAAVRYNGQPIDARAGLDGGTLTLTGQDLKSVLRGREQRFQEPGRGSDAKPVFRCRLSYTVSTLRTA